MMRLQPGDRARLMELLITDTEVNIFLLSVLDRAGIRADTLSPDGTFYGMPDNGPLRAAVYITSGGLVVPFALDPRDVESIGIELRGDVRPRLLVGPRLATDAFWRGIQLGYAPRLFREHRLYSLRPGQLTVEPDPEVREAMARDVEVACDFAAAMQAEELGIDPRTVDSRKFRSRISQLIRDDRFFVLPVGEIFGFQASASAHCVRGTQVEAVYTPPRLRGHGYATRGLAGMCALLLKQHPLITLHVNEENQAAVKLYERIGFVRAAPFRLISA